MSSGTDFIPGSYENPASVIELSVFCRL